MNPNRWIDHAPALFLLFLLHLVTTHGADHGLAGSCKPTEREAILQFKKETSGNEGRLFSSWDEQQEGDCCRWRGVSCHNTTGHILGLQMPGNPYDYYLNGSIGSSLLELKFLEHLDLSNNRLNPDAFLVGVGSLKNLKHLNLSYNHNYGMGTTCNNIPHWSLGNLSKLEVLDLSEVGDDDCSWGSFEWVSHLSSLRYLSMSGANLSEATNLFQAINGMPSLSYLDLSYCELLHFVPASASGLIPVQYQNFTMLKHLDLSFDKLVFKPPHWIGNLTSLEYLDLSVNVMLEDVLLRNLSRLRTLYLSETSISSNLEDFLLGLSQSVVVDIDLSATTIAGHIPEWIGTFGSLQRLDLSDNNISGTIPKSIGDLRSLKYLDLSDNRLNGSIPWSIGNLRSLKELALNSNNYVPFAERTKNSNNLDGSIPWSIGNLASLNELRLGKNNLNGSIPESLWQLRLLSVLDLSDNSLHGIVTELQLSSLSKLNTLFLGGNSLQLKVPLEWVPPFNLSDLSVSSCILGQEFPRWIRTQQQLERLQMQDSCISGALPPWIWNFSSSLIHVNLSSNTLTGAIPGPIALSGIYSIDLSSNKLVGNLPELGGETAPVEVNLSNNSLSGYILKDADIVHRAVKLDLSMNKFIGIHHASLCKTNLVALYLSDNQLSGPLPDCICSSDRIIDVRLSNNNFSGTLPQSPQNCSSLLNLDLGGNRLSGEIPDWMAESMVKLRILGLTSNRFSGSIPSSLGNLTELRILDLSHNNLSGSIPSTFGRFAAMGTTPGSDNDEYDSRYQYEVGEDKSLILQVKGALRDYTTQLKHVRFMDLSGNRLCGQIPSQLGNLTGLQSLNLSNNHLFGNIPLTLGNISFLESLDLSKNMLYGGIPQALEDLSLMSTFDVSYNNLSGTIPTQGQFSTYPNTSYMGNPGLCGPPLSKPCTSSSPKNHDATPPNAGNHGTFWFLLGLAPGFVFGFWIFWGPLLLMTRWRYAYFRFLDDVRDKYLRHYLYVF